MYTGNLIYEDHPLPVWWLKLILGSILLVTFIMGLVFFTIDKAASLVMLSVTVFDSLLFYVIMPRAYQIYSDRIRVVLGGPFGMNVNYKDIKSVKQVSGSQAFGSNGIRFTTSNKYVLEISRKGKMGVTISPAGGDVFLEQLNQALKTYSSGRDSTVG
jgi:hypothetical protein